MGENRILVKRNTVIIGAGKAGSLLVEDIHNEKDMNFNIVGFIDDNKKIGSTMHKVKVIGKINDISRIVQKYEITEVIIAMPSAGGALIRKIVEKLKKFNVSFKLLPRTSEVLLQPFSKDYSHHLRKMKIEDLIGGSIDKLDLTKIKEQIKRETVLITGAAGSIGSELSRQIASHRASKIIFYDWWENGMFYLRNELVEKYPEGNFEFIIGDIKDSQKINYILKKHKPNTIFHAAAYKHVPLMESNGTEAIKNNIFGTRVLARVAIRNGVGKFVLVSSDKAVNPTNIMGATKRASEKIIHILSEGQNTTSFCAVRFGNVMNSNGSVIPTFKKQIASGGPLTVTDREINRFFMTIPEAVMLILKAWMMGVNNDLFVFDMGDPIKIYDLAEWMILLEGLVPHKDIAVNIIGLRPGEKLYEEVLVKQEFVIKTSEASIFRTKNYMKFDKVNFLNNLLSLEEVLKEGDIERIEILDYLQKMVSTFMPAGHSATKL